MATTVKAPAKVNLLLKVVAKRSDGHHELRSVFWKVDLFDTLTFHESDGRDIEIACGHPDVPADESNLVVRAAEALRNEAGFTGGITIELVKAIPVAAGLGGGSSDAAAALVALDELWGANVPRERLAAIALAIGADIPFFLGGPCAWVEGVGERLTPLDVKKSAPLLLVTPGFGISAAVAYAKSSFDFAPFERPDELAADFASAEPQRIARWLDNDLEPWALAAHPSLAALKHTIETADPPPLGVVMTGSGPTLVAVYPTMTSCRKAENALKDAAPFVKAVEALIR